MKKKLTAKQLQARLKKIKLLLLDVDGVMTDGRIFYSEMGWTRTYHIHDGYGIKLIQSFGIPVGVISGGNSEELKERLKVLKIEHFVIGSEDKLKSLTEVSEKLNIPFEHICYVGDDLFDIPALTQVGLGVSVPNAVDEVKKIAHFITKKSGGHGAVREVIDAIRHAQKLSPKISQKHT